MEWSCPICDAPNATTTNQYTAPCKRCGARFDIESEEVVNRDGGDHMEYWLGEQQHKESSG